MMNGCTTAEAARRLEAAGLGSTPDNLRSLIRRGKIRAERFGDRWAVDTESLADYIERRTRE